MLSVANISKGYASANFWPTRVDWEDIPQIITTKVWSNILWAGRYRKEMCFVGSYYAALDIDDGLTKKEVAERLEGYKYMLGPTKSDGIDKVSDSGTVKPACDRFRVLIPWEKPIDRFDVYRFNMTRLITEFDADIQTRDGGRPWQKCKNVEILKLHGKSMSVDTDLPEEETEEYKIKQLKKAKSAMKRGAPLPAKVQDFLQGHIVTGFTNNHLFYASCQLFNRGFTFDEVMEYLEQVPSEVSLRKDFNTTVLSAARATGAM